MIKASNLIFDGSDCIEAPPIITFRDGNLRDFGYSHSWIRALVPDRAQIVLTEFLGCQVGKHRCSVRRRSEIVILDELSGLHVLLENQIPLLLCESTGFRRNSIKVCEDMKFYTRGTQKYDVIIDHDEFVGEMAGTD